MRFYTTGASSSSSNSSDGDESNPLNAEAESAQCFGAEQRPQPLSALHVAAAKWSDRGSLYAVGSVCCQSRYGESIQTDPLISLSPNFNTYSSSDRLAQIAARVVDEFSHQDDQLADKSDWKTLYDHQEIKSKGVPQSEALPLPHALLFDTSMAML
ncbi:hypothetical protein PS1_043990 [Malus domestica]